MKSIKAIISGSLFIIIVILFLQLAFIFIAVAYNAVAKDYPFLNEITAYFRYILGIPIFVVIMFAGGYITASIANFDEKMKVWFHTIAVGLITVGAMMYSAMENADLTLTGIVVIAMALSATSAGGLYWWSNNITDDPK